MRLARSTSLVAAVVAVGACGTGEPQPRPIMAPKVALAAPRLPSGQREFAPSLLQIDRTAHAAGDVSDGTMLSDVDSCATCHADAAAQWSTSAHSFASFGNPIYRVNVELARHDLGKDASQHCGGCHDMPLMVDGLMTTGEVPAADLRAHSGVTCRLCHGVKSTTKDGNGSYVWSNAPIEAPVAGDLASIARHKQQVGLSAAPGASGAGLGTELCVSCHRGFLSPDMGMPVHLSGVDESGMWRSSAYTGNGMARVDKVDQKTCIDCHMEREPASAGEAGAKHGTIASHRFLGGHTWMASMRGDAEHLRRLQAKLEGAASIDVAGARIEQASGARWQLPADVAEITPGARVAFDVVIRNLLVGHRFPGGVLDIQDAWVEVEIADSAGKRLASSGLAHERDPGDEEAHVLRTLVVDDQGRVLEEHQVASFRTQISTQTLAAREAQVTRFAFDVPTTLTPGQLPLRVTARLRHRSRTLAMQATVCTASKTRVGQAFIAGARGARDVALDPCKPQPITLIAQTQIEVGQGAKTLGARPAWERLYEYGMALAATVTERLEEAHAVLDAALAAVPADEPKAPAGGPRDAGSLRSTGRGPESIAPARARAMVLVQLGWVASKQGRVDDALALIAQARLLLPAPGPAVLDAVAADALARGWRWRAAVAPAKACTERAPANSGAWMIYARVLGSIGDDAGALAAATRGLELAPRDPDLLRSQATALAALGRPEAAAALAAYDRFRSPDDAAALRIQCAAESRRCARAREQGATIVLQPAR